MRSSLLPRPGQGPRWSRPGRRQPGSRGVCIPYRRTERRFRQSGSPSSESARRRQAGSPAVCRSASLACRWISTHRGVTPRIGSSIECSTHPSPCCATRTYLDSQRCRRYRIECAHGMDSARLNPLARSVGADDFECREIRLPPTAWARGHGAPTDPMPRLHRAIGAPSSKERALRGVRGRSAGSFAR